MRERAKPRRQCQKCPWKVDTDPHEIPNGYCVDKHRGLRKTIAPGASLDRIGAPLQMMACHETGAGAELACVGWLHHQLGAGNNIPLRLAAMRGHVDTNYELVGEQHERFEDTLPEDP